MAQRVLLLAIAAIATLVGWNLLRPSNVHASPDKTPAQALNARLEARAQNVKDGDESSVRLLADEVFNTPHVFGQMPNIVESVVKERLVNAELAHMRGSHPGVREEAIVRLVNSAADKLGAPDFARTNKNQVRFLRMSMLSSTPHFMGKGMVDGSELKSGEQLDSPLSPLQAAHLIATLVDQKTFNPEYQVTPEQWDATKGERAQRKLDLLRQLRNSGGKTEMVMRRGDDFTHQKSEQMLRVLANSGSGLSISQTIDLADEALSALGMGR
jgi:hypothetical protein